MSGKLAKVLEVFRRDGLYTFGYMAAAACRSRIPAKYQYRKWRRIHEKKKSYRWNPDVSFAVILIGEVSEHCKKSVEQQTFPAKEVIYVTEEERIAQLCARTTSKYLVLMPGTDEMAHEALGRMAQYSGYEGYKNCRLLYSDEDSVDKKGRRHSPVFKPEFSPDTLASYFYMGGLLVIERSLLNEINEVVPCDVVQGGYFVALAASMLVHDKEVCHVPEVLYHRHSHVQPELAKLSEKKKHICEAFGKKVQTEKVPDCQAVRVLYELQEKPFVSIVIPSKDNPSMLRKCLMGIVSNTVYDNYEIVVVDNGSSDENRIQYEQMCAAVEPPCTYHYEPMVFNFARMCNLGAEIAKGTYVLFLNDDIEILETKGMDWLERLLGQAMQPHTGAVGAKLLYPEGRRIQHIGVVNYAKSAAHLYAGFDDVHVLGGGRNRYDYNVSIVTGACMMLAKEKFTQAGGFDETLEVTYNDVELCIRLMEAGYRQVVRNDVVLLHHESVSRGMDSAGRSRFFRHMRERNEVFRMHPAYLFRDDYYSPNLTMQSMNGAINTQEGPFYRKPVCTKKLEKGEEHDGQLRCGLYYVENDNRIRIHGYAYLEHINGNNFNKIQVALVGKNVVYYIRCQKVYDPVFAQNVHSEKNLNFVRFYADCASIEIEEGDYEIGIVVKKRLTNKTYVRITKRRIHNISHKK